MGMEKFFDITCRIGGLRPSAAVLVATVRALKHHGGNIDGGMAEIERGAANLARHIGIVKQVRAERRRRGQQVPRPTRADELELVQRLALEHGAYAAEINAGFEQGGKGATALAEAVVAAADEPNEFRFAYPYDAPIEEKIRAIATRRLRRRRRLPPRRRRRTRPRRSRRRASASCPICMAKTHLSLSHDASLLNAPTGFTVTVRDLRPYTGAGWIVALCGDMQTMPGLGKAPAAFSIDIDEHGNIVGLF